MNKLLVSLIILLLSWVVEVKSQLINILPEVPSDITQEIGTCDALLLKLLASNYIPKSETNSLCSIFRNKIQKVDTPLNDLNCSVFGSILIQCDLKLAITSSDILRQYFMRPTKPNMKELYLLTTIMSNFPQEISTVLGKDDIIEDSNEIINDKLSILKKDISRNQLVDLTEISYLFGSVSQLVRMGSRNMQHLKALNSILDYQNKSLRFHPVVDLDTFLLNFSLLSKAYFFLKTPTDFEDIPLSLQQMAYSVSRIKIREVKNLAVLNEYIITRKLFIDSGVYLIQGFLQHPQPESREPAATVVFCRLDGSPFENISLDLIKSDVFKLEHVSDTCEYQLVYQNGTSNQTAPAIDLGKDGRLSGSVPKLKISSRFILAREAGIPMLNQQQSSSKFEVTGASIFLGEKLSLGQSQVRDVDVQYRKSLDDFQFALELQTSLETFDIGTIYKHFTAFEITAVPPFRTMGTRTVKFIPAIIERGSLKLYLNLASDEFVCSSSEFSLKLIIGGSSSNAALSPTGSRQEEAILSIVLTAGQSSEDAQSIGKLCPHKVHPKVAGFYPKEEMAYKFKEPRKLPGPLFPYSFSALIFSTLLFIIPRWNKLSRVDQGLSTFKSVPLVKMASFVSLAASLFIILCYWHTLNIFQFVYIFTPVVCVFFILLKLSLRRSTFHSFSQEKSKSD